MTTVDTVGDEFTLAEGRWTSVAIGIGGNATVSYQAGNTDGPGGSLRVARPALV